MTTALLIIDPQRDFTCPDGALYVGGADRDMQRLGLLLGRMKAAISKVFITMDSHREMHISHPNFWIDRNGRHPDAFTRIRYEDVVNGKWRAVLGNDISTDYLRQLEARGKTHTIWPLHCIVGSEGYEINHDLKEALTQYAAHEGEVSVVHKGDCMFAEHFSALRAEVENELFAETKLNTTLLNELKGYERVMMAGECADICVRETLRDLNEYAPTVVGKLVILRDCMSALDAAFATDTDEVYQRAMALGARFTTSEMVISCGWQ